MKGILIWLPLLAVLGCGSGHESAAKLNDIEDISSMQQRRDGLFDIICNDGRREIRSDYEIKHNQVCLAPSRFLQAGYYGVESGYDRFCSHRVDPVYDEDRLERVSLTFLGECGNYRVTLSCVENVCRTGFGSSRTYELMVMRGQRYRFTRFSDGESAVFGIDCRQHKHACGGFGR